MPPGRSPPADHIEATQIACLRRTFWGEHHVHAITEGKQVIEGVAVAREAGESMHGDLEGLSRCQGPRADGAHGPVALAPAVASDATPKRRRPLREISRRARVVEGLFPKRTTRSTG